MCDKDNLISQANQQGTLPGVPVQLSTSALVSSEDHWPRSAPAKALLPGHCLVAALAVPRPACIVIISVNFNHSARKHRRPPNCPSGRAEEYVILPFVGKGG